MNLPIAVLLEHTDTLSERLGLIHQQVLRAVPALDRIACALYDPDQDLLKTFINSTRDGQPIAGYQYRLADSASLSALARSGATRVIEHMEAEVHSTARHAQWVREQGYQSSFTIPLYDGDAFMAMLFFDSRQRAAFTPTVQCTLELHSSLISMSISGELVAVRALIESVRVARELTEARDFETGRHLERMARYSQLLALHVAPMRGLGDEFVESVHLFAALHDIGKIGVPDRVLLKPGKLDEEETRVMRGHVGKGVAIIDRVLGDGAQHALPNGAILRNIVAMHHEYLDGSGYPAGLRGDAVPLEARVVTVADIYDALTSFRPYKTVWDQRSALAELQRMAEAGKLDADCVQTMIDHADEVTRIQQRYADPPPD